MRRARTHAAFRLLHFRLRRHFYKSDVVNFLVRALGYRRYLEVCTTKTGRRFAEIDRGPLDRCDRLMYRCPDGYTDGRAVDFRSPTDDISACLADIRARHLAYDIALVDSWHTYPLSIRDLGETFALLAPGGMMVVHDCLPPNEFCARVEPGPHPDWLGASYRAFVDFLMAHPQLPYAIVDTDCGCGLVWKVANRPPPRIFQTMTQRAPSHAGVIEAWRAIGDYRSAIRFHLIHRHELSNVVSLADFFAADWTGDQPEAARITAPQRRGGAVPAVQQHR